VSIKDILCEIESALEKTPPDAPAYATLREVADSLKHSTENGGVSKDIIASAIQRLVGSSGLDERAQGLLSRSAASLMSDWGVTIPSSLVSFASISALSDALVDDFKRYAHETLLIDTLEAQMGSSRATILIQFAAGCWLNATERERAIPLELDPTSTMVRLVLLLATSSMLGMFI
jgi:hypothetical protein